MSPIKSFIPVATLAVVLSLELAIVTGQSNHAEAQSLPWQIGQIFRPPNRGAPPNTAGGASRGPCLKGQVIALMPTGNFGLTVAEYPTFFWYIPESTARTAEFQLWDKNNNLVYQTKFIIPDRSGIISLNLPSNTLPPLKLDQMYRWSLTALCNDSDDPSDRSGNAIVNGWIERTQPSPSLANELEKAALRDRPAVYASAGIWYDSLTALAELRRSAPDDSTVAAGWEKLLNSAGLDGAIVRAPIFESQN